MVLIESLLIHECWNISRVIYTERSETTFPRTIAITLTKNMIVFQLSIIFIFNSPSNSTSIDLKNNRPFSTLIECNHKILIRHCYCRVQSSVVLRKLVECHTIIRIYLTECADRFSSVYVEQSDFYRPVYEAILPLRIRNAIRFVCALVWEEIRVLERKAGRAFVIKKE